MQVIKPGSLSLLKQTYYLKQQQFVVSALSFFKLGADNRLLPENTQWPRLQPYLDGGVILDTGHAKGCAEWLLAGCAYAVDEKPIQKMVVKAVVGKSEKSVEVVGDRTYGRTGFLGGKQESEITPFVKMPLSFAQSYGGVGYSQNEKGKGRLDKENLDEAVKGHPLANLYVKGESIKADNRSRTEACFLPRALTHPERAKYQGTYDDQWLKEIHPGFPDDTDLKLFNTAPLLQQQKTFFAPNTEYELSGFHPQISCIKGQLPNVFVRAFVTQTEGDHSHFKEIETHIDTVWFFPELELGIAVHRGVLAVNDSLGLDIKNLLLALESPTDTPRERDYYQQVLQQRLDWKTAAGHAFNASQLLPQLTEEEQAERIKQYAEAAAMQEQKHAQQRHKQLKKLQEQYPHLDWQAIEQEQKEEPISEPPPGPIPQALLEKGDFDLTPHIEWSRKQAASAKEKSRERLQALQALKAQQPEPEPEPESEECALARSERVVLLQSSHNTPINPLADDATPEEKKAYLKGAVETSERRVRQLAPAVVQEKTVGVAAGKVLRKKVLDLLDQNASLAGRDLAGADLSGLDLSGQDLRDVMLEQADLTGTKFNHALCDGLVLIGAKLDDACFEGCRFIKTNFSSASGQNVRFTHCLFDHCLMIHSEFKQCDFTESEFNKMNWVNGNVMGCLFTQSKWMGMQMVQSCFDGSSWKQAVLTQCTFLLCDLTESQWQQGKMERCAFLKTTFDRVDFSYLMAERIQVSAVKGLNQCSFYKSRWQYCGWRELSFQDCVLSQATFVSCDFSFAQLKQSNFDASLWKSCVLLQVQMSDADGSKALFYESNLCKGHFKEVNMPSVTFYQTDLSEVKFDQCHLLGAKYHPLSSMEKVS